MDPTDPNVQLAMAQGRMMPYGQQGALLQNLGGSSYVQQVESQATAVTTGGLNAASSAILGAPMVLGMAGMFSSGRIAKGLDRGLSAFDPFSGAMDLGMGVLGGRISMGAAGLGLGGAALAGYTLNTGVDFAKNQMLEGQRNFLATRQLVRQLPRYGFGGQSVLTPQMPALDSGAQVSQLNRQLAGIGSEFGMNVGQTRSMLGGLANTGMIDTSSVQRISSSLRNSLRELKEISALIGGDIDEAVRTYQMLDKMGMRGASSRVSMLRRMTSTSAMTGMSLNDVAGFVAQGSSATQALGLSGGFGGGLALGALNTSAVMQRTGRINSDYAARFGGSFQGVAARMLELQLGALGSGTGTQQLGHAFTAGGGFNRAGLDQLLGGGAMHGTGMLSKVDPYALSGMQEQLGGLQGAAVLARVDALGRQHARDPLKRNREQFKYLSGLGISDPTEQLQYIDFLRTQPRAEFAAGLQGASNRLAQAGDPSRVQAKASALSDAIDRVVDSLGHTFQRAGEALQRDVEGSNRRVALALGGSSRSWDMGRPDMQTMGWVSRGILRGDVPMHGRNLAATHALLADSPTVQDAVGRSMIFQGVTPAMLDRLTSSNLDAARVFAGRATGGLAGLFDVGEHALSQALGLESRSGFARAGRGAFGELLGGSGGAGGARGGIPVGPNRYGVHQSVGSADFVRLAMQEMGATGMDFDPSTGRMVRLNEARANQVSAMAGGRFREAWGSGVGSQIEAGLLEGDRSRFRLGSAVFGGLALGGAGAFLGSFGGVWGALGGAAVGGAAGAIGGYYGGGAFYDRVRGYAAQMGVDLSPRMTPAIQRQLSGSFEALGQKGSFDELSKAAFGQRFGELSAQDRLVFREMLRRHGGETGAALAGPASGALSENTVAAGLSTQLLRAQLESGFGYGAAGAGYGNELTSQRSADIDMEGLLTALGEDTPGESAAREYYGIDGPGRWGSTRELRQQLGELGIDAKRMSRLFELSGRRAIDLGSRGTGRRVKRSTLMGFVKEARARSPEAADELDSIEVDINRLFDRATTGELPSAMTAFAAPTQGQGRRSAGAELYQALGSGQLLPEQFTEDLGGGLRGQLNQGFEGRAAGVMAGLEHQLAAPDMAGALRGAAGEQYLNATQRAASLGSLVDQMTINRTGRAGVVNPDRFAGAREQVIDELVKSGQLSPRDATLVRSSLGTGNVQLGAVEGLQKGLQQLSPEAKSRLREQAQATRQLGRQQAIAQYWAAQDERLGASLSAAQGRAGQDLKRSLASLAPILGESANLDLLRESIGAGGDDLLAKLRDSPEAVQQLEGLQDDLRKRIDSEKDPGVRQMLEDELARLSGIGTIVGGNTSIERVAATVAGKSFRGSGGKLQFSAGQLATAAPELGIQSLQGPAYRAFQQLFAPRGATAQNLLAASGLSDTPEDRKRLLELAGGRFKAAADRGDVDAGVADLTRSVSKRSVTDRDTVQALQRNLERLVAANIGEDTESFNQKQNDRKEMIQAVKDIAKVVTASPLLTLKPEQLAAAMIGVGSEGSK